MWRGKCYKFPSPYGVSFILIYIKTIKGVDKMEVSFRLLTEYHSFLCKAFNKDKTLSGMLVVFPSPYGVSFILI